MEKFIQFLIPLQYNSFWSTYPTSSNSQNIENAYNGEENISTIYTSNSQSNFTINATFTEKQSGSYFYINEFQSQNDNTPIGDFLSGLDSLVATGSEGLYIINSFTPRTDYSLVFDVDPSNHTSEYSIKDIVYSKLYKVPMYDQGYSTSFRFSKTPYESKSYTKTTYPNYDIAFSNNLIITNSYTFSGLSSSEKNIFLQMIKDFGNSPQPFWMLVWTNNTFTATKVIMQDFSDSKDKYNLWKVNMSLIEIK